MAGDVDPRNLPRDIPLAAVPCPICGHCPTCGRGGYAAPWPSWPVYPTTPIYPNPIWVYDPTAVTWTAPNTTVCEPDTLRNAD